MPWMYLLELDTAELADVCILISCGLPYLLFIANSTMKLSYCKWILEMLAVQLHSKGSGRYKWLGRPTRITHFQFLRNDSPQPAGTTS